MNSIIYDKYDLLIKNTKGLNYKINIHELIDYQFIAPHCHNFYELELILDGHFDHIVDGNMYTSTSASIYIISPLSFHGMRFKNEETRVFNVSFLADAVPAYILAELLRIDSFYCIELNTEQYEEFYREMSFFLREYKKYEQGTDDSILKNALERILLLFLRDAKKANAEHTDLQLQKVLSFLHKNFRNPITLNDVACVANMSAPYFSTYFSIKTNSTFIEYLNQLRVNYAASLLLMPDATIKKVALECGFSSASYFSKVFFKAYGISPTAFRLKKRAK